MLEASRLSVTHEVRIESTVATVRPVSFRLIQSSTLRNVAVRSYTSGISSRTSSMCAAGSLPVTDGMPPVRRSQRAIRRTEIPP